MYRPLLIISAYLTIVLIFLGCASSPRYTNTDWSTQDETSSSDSIKTQRNRPYLWQKFKKQEPLEKREEEAPPGNPDNGSLLRGLASFVADEMHGRRTASGEIFNMRELVAAHPNLPFDSLVRVTDPATGNFVDVRIIDRGPFVKGRIIDLSFEAAKRLGFIEAGTLMVELQVLRQGP